MSYADVAAHNAPPPSQQPHPDPALLNTEPPTADNIIDDAKVNIVAPNFKAQLDAAGPDHNEASGAKRPSSAKDRARKYVHDAEEEGLQLWAAAKQLLFRPAVAGGLIGLLNIGLISGVGYTFYACPHLRRNPKIITSTAAAALAVFTGEGYLAEVYRRTPAGRKEEQQAKQEGAALYRYSREHLLRPGVLGGIVGAVNVGILGGVWYIAFANWDKPHWDRRLVSMISVSLFTLWAGEGLLAEQYRKK